MGATVEIGGKQFMREDSSRSWRAGSELGSGGQAVVYRARECTGSEDVTGELVRAIQHVNAARVGPNDDPGPALAAALRAFTSVPDVDDHALKVYVARADDQGEDMTRRSEAEVAALRKVSHPHVLKLVDAGTLQDGRPFAVFPLLERGSFVLRQEEYVGCATACLEAIAEVLDGVAHLHAKEMVHRDLKPENVFVAKDGRLVVGDLGLVFDRERDESLTRAGERVGNWQFGPDWGYFEAEYQQDPRVDLYAAAKLLWWLASGRALLPRENWNAPEFSRVRALLNGTAKNEDGGASLTSEQRGEILKAIAAAVSKATETCVERFKSVDNRAPLYLWKGDRNLPRSKRKYRCRDCNREVGTVHDNMCDWLRRERKRCEELWPELVKEPAGDSSEPRGACGTDES